MMGFLRNKQRVKALDRAITNSIPSGAGQDGSGKPAGKVKNEKLEQALAGGGKDTVWHSTKTEGYTLLYITPFVPVNRYATKGTL